MKKTSFLYLSLAAIVAGSFTSCQDEEMGFDYETVRGSLYEKQFLNEFGTPAVGHEWGFDAASYFAGINKTLTRGTSGQHSYKQNEHINGVQVSVAYGQPADITPKEYEEVTAWFRNHRVNWTNTPSCFATNLSDVSSTNTRQCDHKAYTIDASNPGYGSLDDSPYAANNPLGPYYEFNDNNFIFHNGWIQHVSSHINTRYDEDMRVYNLDKNLVYASKNKADDYYAKIVLEDGTVIFREADNNGMPKQNGKQLGFQSEDEYGNIVCTGGQNLKPVYHHFTNSDPSAHMDHLHILGLTAGTQSEWAEHVKDFNGGNGYGWDNNTTHNATFVLDADINSWCFQGSQTSGYYDKYYVVYLEGDGYSGYYLGFDFEAYGQNGIDKNLAADGICDDWIIKITNAGTTQQEYARIMCEDLGATDFDFNDVVMDVTVTTYDQNSGSAIVTLKIRAVGGTIPVCVCYGNHPSSNVANYAFKKKVSEKDEHELHAIFETDVTTPINVGSKGVTSTKDVTWKMFVGYEGSELWRKLDENNGELRNQMDYIITGQQLDLQKFNIYVKHVDRAEWLIVHNFDDEDAVSVPQKFCVPQTVDWTSENQHITDKYPDFRTWVQNPTKPFWNNTSSSANSVTSDSQRNTNTQTVSPGIAQNYQFDPQNITSLQGDTNYKPSSVTLQFSRTSSSFSVGLLTSDGTIVGERSVSNPNSGYIGVTFSLTNFESIRNSIVGFTVTSGSATLQGMYF